MQRIVAGLTLFLAPVIGMILWLLVSASISQKAIGLGILTILCHGVLSGGNFVPRCGVCVVKTTPLKGQPEGQLGDTMNQTDADRQNL